MDYLNCFSVLRTHFVFTACRTDVASLTNQAMGNRMQLKVCSDKDDPDCVLHQLDGLRAFSFLFVNVFLINFLNRDLVSSNRWQDLNMVVFNIELWTLISSLHIFMEYLFLFSAFLQGHKLFLHFNSNKQANSKP